MADSQTKDRVAAIMPRETRLLVRASGWEYVGHATNRVDCRRASATSRPSSLAGYCVASAPDSFLLPRQRAESVGVRVTGGQTARAGKGTELAAVHNIAACGRPVSEVC